MLASNQGKNLRGLPVFWEMHSVTNHGLKHKRYGVLSGDKWMTTREDTVIASQWCIPPGGEKRRRRSLSSNPSSSSVWTRIGTRRAHVSDQGRREGPQWQSTPPPVRWRTSPNCSFYVTLHYLYLRLCPGTFCQKTTRSPDGTIIRKILKHWRYFDKSPGCRTSRKHNLSKVFGTYSRSKTLRPWSQGEEKKVTNTQKKPSKKRGKQLHIKCISFYDKRILMSNHSKLFIHVF